MAPKKKKSVPPPKPQIQLEKKFAKLEGFFFVFFFFFKKFPLF